jgi:diguanylate cyclase (GGDEF)-like protein
MTTPTPMTFDGFDELLRRPLEGADPRSFSLVRKILADAAPAPPFPFSYLIGCLSGVTVAPREARNHWKKILDHKKRLEQQLARIVSIRAAAVDYYDQLGVDAAFAPSGEQAAPSPARVAPVKQPPKPEERFSGPVATPGFYLERLKEEMHRARRYRHALSVILFNVDMRAVDDALGDKVLPLIVKIINKAVRTVDILGRHSDFSFLLMLPNTNKREALELAERLKKNIAERTGRIEGLTAGVSLSIAIGQCAKDDAAGDFTKRLEHLAAAKKASTPAAISVLD